MDKVDKIDHVYHANRYNADSACDFCQCVLNHAPWCATRNSLVSYAYQIVAESARLTLGDSLALHSLGVTWEPSQG
jgi:glycerol-3-phosphate cytidylyltransferase-like family protein